LLEEVSKDFFELINKSNEDILFKKEPFFKDLKKLDFPPIYSDYYGIESKEDVRVVKSIAEE
jgi:hypothetical protein